MSSFKEYAQLGTTNIATTSKSTHKRTRCVKIKTLKQRILAPKHLPLSNNGLSRPRAIT